MRCNLFVILILAFLAQSSVAQNNDFRAYRDSVQNAQNKFVAEHNQNSASASGSSEFQSYQSQVFEEFEAFKFEMEQKWGDFKNRSKTEWVEYLDAGNARVEVDFERDQVVLEVLIDKSQNTEQRVASLPVMLIEVIQSRGTEHGFEATQDDYNSVLNRPVLSNQLTKRVRETNADFALRVIENNQPSVRQTTGGDGVERAVLTLDFALAPDAIRERAERVQSFVYKYSDQYNLYPSLVFAIIHTESFFNPMAQSPANALGLMQLVPNGGGADAYQAVYGSNDLPSPEFLFDPENNIQLGCAYINVLLNTHLNDINNDLTKQYLAIAAYNTGSSNVFRAYDRNGSKPRAIRKIESMTPQQNYEFLIQNLPHEETRTYLRKVVERSQLYESWGD